MDDTFSQNLRDEIVNEVCEIVNKTVDFKAQIIDDGIICRDHQHRFVQLKISKNILIVLTGHFVESHCTSSDDFSIFRFSLDVMFLELYDPNVIDTVVKESIRIMQTPQKYARTDNSDM